MEYSPEQLNRMKDVVIEGLDVAPAGFKPWAKGSIDNLVERRLAYMDYDCRHEATKPQDQWTPQECAATATRQYVLNGVPRAR